MLGISGRVVHCKREKYDVYIGRGPCPRTGLPGMFGNPFILDVDGTREEVIAMFEIWVREQPDLIHAIKTELSGKTLGCWCTPKACHGDVLLRIAGEF